MEKKKKAGTESKEPPVLRVLPTSGRGCGGRGSASRQPSTTLGRSGGAAPKCTGVTPTPGALPTLLGRPGARDSEAHEAALLAADVATPVPMEGVTPHPF